MTEYEIIKALECCSKHQNSCEKNCPLDSICSNVRDCLLNLSKNALDLINRQKAEIEQLNKDLMKCKLEKEMLYHVAEEIQTVTIEDFAERLKKYLCLNLREGISVVTNDDIDKLVKEKITEVKK